VEAAKELAAVGPGLHLTHQTGERDLEMVRSAYGQAGLAADVAPFFDDMARRLRRTDLIVCRAGATTLAEVAAAGKAAILVPLPTATDDHQRKNAEALEASGAAVVLPQSLMNGRTLGERILGLARDPEARDRLASAVRATARPDAARVIVNRALELVERSG
jgi:UDP-N-acetylglucosamine--N-acetylmuramyl-(pentapeptide) pyrophosphoryl-undecaprenol N-acetylglucosamine transferase